MRRRRFLQGLGVAGAACGPAPFFKSVARASAARAVAAPAGGVARARTLAAALQDAGAALGLRLTRYDRSHMAATATAALPATSRSTKLVLEGTAVDCRSRIAPARDRPDAHDVEVTFRVLRGRLPNGAVAVTLSLTRWSREAYVMIPGAVYGGNRFASRHIPFPPLLAEPSDIGPHVPAIISDIPRLDNQAGESRILLSAVDTAVPTIAVRLPGRDAGEPGANASTNASTNARANTNAGGDLGIGILMLGEPRTSIGDTGLAIVESADRTQATLSLAAPSVRPDFRYSLCNSRVPSTDRGADLEAGASITLRFRLLAFPCPDVPTLFDRWFEARRDRVGAAVLRHDLPLSAGRRLVEERLLADHWIEDEGIFAARAPTHLVGPPASANGTNGANGATGAGAHLESTFRTGADGALALAAPLLMAAPVEARKRTGAILDFQLRGQAATGLFHAAGNGSAWWDEGDAAPAGTAADARLARRRWTHVGRNAEALFLACKQLMLLQRIEAKYRIPDKWQKRLVRAADALVRLWNRHDQLGQYASIETGDIVVGGSAAGALAPAALALAARVLESETYLRTATAMAAAFHDRFVETGLTLGDAPAALQCPDSRSAAGLLESFVTLADATGDAAWFDKAAEAAHQAASWVVAWDAPFAEPTTLARMGARTTGAVLVSAEDKWALPGFAGLSGDALFRLYRATGRVAYLELLRETVHNSSGYVATRDRLPAPEARPGWVAGRIPVGDALGAPGDVPDATPAGTAQACVLLCATEIPSLYVQPDTGFCFAFDHVDARVTSQTPALVKVSVHNPTAYEADLRLFAEPDRDRARPLPPHPLWGARSLALGPGATEESEFVR
ncbi:MAG: hypothetical protein ABUS79_04660 [Pseudomonadota bacterium]